MNCFFRVDASISIGTGHVMRCRTLAYALKNRGANIHFIMRNEPGHMGEILINDGFIVTLLPKAEDSESKGVSCESWLGVSQQIDAIQTIQVIENQGCEWLIVDNYGLDHIWELHLQQHTRKLMAIDDLANRTHLCDVLLDQNYVLESKDRYQSRVPNHCLALLGPEFAMIHPEYARFQKLKSPHISSVRRVLVFMGGSDSNDITGKVLAALSNKKLTHLQVDLVIGVNFIHKNRLLEQARIRNNTTIHTHLPHLAELMSNADLAIGGGGTTTWERLHMGLPSLVISLAENQIAACKALDSVGLIEYLGDAFDIDVSTIERAIFKQLKKLNQSSHLKAENLVLVDGLGASRVAEVIIPSLSKDLTLRLTNEADVSTYFLWINDPVVRSSSFKVEPITWESHCEWFKSKLNDKNSILYIFELKGLPVGQVRFELVKENAIIDYSLVRFIRGRGLAKDLLRMGIKSVKNYRLIKFIAFVKACNKASITTLDQLGFIKEEIKSNQHVANFKFSLLNDFI